jgi:response regulator RpfG family c-di-GMP phosphodiesterase
MQSELQNKLTRIQVIDDNSFDQELVQMGLKNIAEKIHLQSAFSLDELETESITDIDLVICDLNLLGATIDQTLKKLNDLFPNSKKIVMSGVEPLEFQALKDTYKFDTFLCKDYIFEKIEKTVLSVIDTTI